MSLIICLWALGGLGSGRLHPVLIVYLVLVILFQETLVPHYILQRGRIGSGDVLDAPPRFLETRDPWIRQTPMPFDAIYEEPRRSG
jgi:hypothetical protein